MIRVFQIVCTAALAAAIVGCGSRSSTSPAGTFANRNSAAREFSYRTEASPDESAGAVDSRYAKDDVGFAAAEPAPASPLPTASVAPGSESASGFSDAARGAEKLMEHDTVPADRPAPDVAPPPRRPEIQSGTLTAGSIDDHDRFDDYRNYLSETMQHDPHEQLPRLPIGRRVMILVTDGANRPVGDARVVVSQENAPDSQTATLLDVTTGTDGRAMMMTGIDGGTSGQSYLVTVHPPDGSAAVTANLNSDQTPWTITLPQLEAKLPRQLDLALVVDTTGSMGDELEYLKVEIDSIAATIQNMFPNVDQRFALILYRDEGDQYVTRTFDFTSSLSDFRAQLASQSADGGGDYPEAVHLALEHATRLDWRVRDTARVMFLVGDAPPHDRFAARTLDAVGRLRKQGVRIFPVASSGVAMKAEFVFRATAFMTLGQYLFLTDHSGVGNPHARPNVPEYLVERLDRLMIRMIASELAGKRLAPQEVIAIEHGDRAPQSPPVLEQQQSQYHPQLPIIRAGAIVVPKRSARWSSPWLLAAIVVVCVFAGDVIRERSEAAAAV